jgi:signal transduction histidine kinase
MSEAATQPTPSPGPRKPTSLRARWRLSFFLGMNLLVILVAGGASLIIALEQRHALLRLHEAAADHLAADVQIALDDAQRLLSFAGDTLSLEGITPQDLARLEQAHPAVCSVRVVDADDIAIELLSATPCPSAASASLTPGTVMIQAATRDGDGIIVAELDSARLWAGTVAGLLGDHGYAALLDEAGTVLAAPPDLARAPDRDPADFDSVRHAQDGNSTLQVYRGLEGEWVVGRAERLPGSELFALTETPLTVLWPTLARGAALWGLAFLLTALAGETLIRRIIKTVLVPFATLHQGARAVSQGDYQYRVRLPSAAEREIVDLGTAFNTMIARLQESRRQIDAYTHEMEDIVELRARELSRKALQLEVAADVSSKIATILDPPALIDEVTCLIKDRFEVYHVEILLLDSDGKSLRPVRSQADASTDTISLRDADRSVLAWVARYGETVYVPDVSEDRRYRGSPALPASRCALAIPLVFAGQTIGVLNLEDEHRDAFPRDEIAVLESLANEIAIALHNARLFDALETANRELAQATLEANQMHMLKSRFLLNASHKLRTPLNAIIGYSETILSGVYGTIPDKALDRQRRILENGRMLQALIEDMLDLSSIEAGHMELKLAWVALPPLLDEVMNATHALHQTAYGDHDLALNLSIEGDLLPVWADVDRLRYVLITLMDNAVKFTTAGEVSLTAWAEDNMVFVEVRDTGPGIREDELVYLFEPFQHERGSTASGGRGTGLGLPVSRLLALRHGGDLIARSTLHEGSTFTLRLPARPDGAPPFPEN